jgi:hypothetical protein
MIKYGLPKKRSFLGNPRQKGGAMRKLGKVLWSGLLTAWDGLWIVWMTEIFWFLLCLPIITIPAAFAGMYYTMDQLANGESVDWHTFFEGIKLNFWPGVRWVVINALVIFILYFYFFYLGQTGLNSDQTLLQTLSGIPLGLIVIWTALNAFTFPLMLHQEKPAYSTALRNSLGFYLKWPGYTLAFLLINGIVIGLSVWLVVPWFILTVSFTALMASVLVINKIEEAKQAS